VCFNPLNKRGALCNPSAQKSLIVVFTFNVDYVSPDVLR
jgi:hypothetical protein